MPRQVLSALFGDDRCFMIRPGESTDGLDRIPEHDGNELDFGPGFPAKQVAAVVAWNLADAGKQFRLEHGLVGVCILGLGVTVPDSRDHGVSSRHLRSIYGGKQVRT